MATPLFTWAGIYCGFIRNDRIFDLQANYLGWIEADGRAYERDGKFWGELTDENYLLYRTSMVRPVNRVPRIPPVCPVLPVRHVNRVARIPRVGRVDALLRLVEK